MSLTSWVQPLSVVALACSLLGVASAACSSSSAEGGPDTGTSHDGSVSTDGPAADAPSTKHDSAPEDSASDKDAEAPTCEAGGACGPASVAKYKATAFVNAVGHQGVCSPTQAADFISACVTSTSEATCTTWQETNLMIDGGAGTPCGNCIMPNNTNDNGALWIDPLGGFWPNYGACVQVGDPKNGPACGAAFDEAQGCVTLACDDFCTGTGTCTTNSGCEGCFTAAQDCACATYSTEADTACKAAAAAAEACEPSAKSGNVAQDYAFIIQEICGSGGPSDGGTD